MNINRFFGSNNIGIVSSELAFTANDDAKPLYLDCSGGTVFSKLEFTYKTSNGTTIIDLAATGEIYSGIECDGSRLILGNGIYSNSIMYKDGWFSQIEVSAGQVFVYGR